MNEVTTGLTPRERSLLDDLIAVIDEFETAIAGEEGAERDIIDAALVDSVLHPAAAPVPTRTGGGFERIVALADMEQAYIRWVVDSLDGNVSAAAARLGIARSTIYRLLRVQPEDRHGGD